VFEKPQVDLLISGWSKVLIVQANRQKRIWLVERDHFIGLAAERGARLGRANWYGYHQPRWVKFAHRANRGAHGGASRQPVIDDDHRSALDTWRSLVASKALLSAAGLGHFHACDRLGDFFHATRSPATGRAAQSRRPAELLQMGGRVVLAAGTEPAEAFRLIEQ
jgi:hypothetical protein